MHPVTKYLSDFADVGREKASRKKICLLSIKCEVFISLSYDRILCRICFTLVLSCLFCLFHLFHHYVSIFVCNLLHNVSLLVSPILFCSQIMGLKQFTNGSCIAELSFPFQWGEQDQYRSFTSMKSQMRISPSYDSAQHVNRLGLGLPCVEAWTWTVSGRKNHPNVPVQHVVVSNLT